jgi:hypothetical protein
MRSLSRAPELRLASRPLEPLSPVILLESRSLNMILRLHSKDLVAKPLSPSSHFECYSTKFVSSREFSFSFMRSWTLIGLNRARRGLIETKQRNVTHISAYVET